METPRTEQTSVESQPKVRITIDIIKRKVARDFQVEVQELDNKKRHQPLVRARQVAMYLSHVLIPERSYPEIGRRFGGRDHSTVIHACRLITDLRECTDEEGRGFREKVTGLIDELVCLEMRQYILPFAEADLVRSLSEMSNSVRHNILPWNKIDAESEEMQFRFRFPLSEKKEIKKQRIHSLVPFTPPRPVRLTNADVIMAVADYYGVEAKALEEQSLENELLQYCSQVVGNLQSRLMGRRKKARVLHGELPVPASEGIPMYQLKDDEELMHHDMRVIWQRMTSRDYFSLA